MTETVGKFLHEDFHVLKRVSTKEVTYLCFDFGRQAETELQLVKSLSQTLIWDEYLRPRPVQRGDLPPLSASGKAETESKLVESLYWTLIRDEYLSKKWLKPIRVFSVDNATELKWVSTEEVTGPRRLKRLLLQSVEGWPPARVSTKEATRQSWEWGQRFEDFLWGEIHGLNLTCWKSDQWWVSTERVTETDHSF